MNKGATTHLALHLPISKAKGGPPKGRAAHRKGSPATGAGRAPQDQLSASSAFGKSPQAIDFLYSGPLALEACDVFTRPPRTAVGKPIAKPRTGGLVPTPSPPLHGLKG